MFTTKNLSSYAALFSNFFLPAKNIFDCGKTGLDLKLAQVKSLALCGKEFDSHLENENLHEQKSEAQKNAFDFLQEERRALLALADILSNGEKAKSRAKDISYGEQILHLLENREYLYLHFPDGESPKQEKNFLNRVRIQADYFLKEIDVALKSLPTT